MPDRPGRPDRLVLVVGTGTGVGKTWVASRLIESLRAAGAHVAARKPAQSFSAAEPPGRRDAAVLGSASGEPPEAVCPPHRWYPAEMAPPMAAEVLGAPAFTLDQLVGELRWPASATGGTELVGVVEAAGGVRSPQASDGDAVDLARRLVPDVVLVIADAGLGTINSVRLTTEALAGVCGTGAGSADPTGPDRAPLAVVLNRFDPGAELHRRNRRWLESEQGLRVLVAPGGEEELAGFVQAAPTDPAGRQG